MLVDASQIDRQARVRSDVTVVGSGPGGISCALELARHGFDVTLIESGLKRFSAAAQRLADCDQFDPRRQAPMEECVRRQVGGTSVIWGGRCVPFDPIDFESRSYIPQSDWPVGYEEISPYFAQAAAYFFCGAPIFNAHDLPELMQKTIVPNFPEGEVLSSELERWSLPTNFGREHLRKLAASPRIRLLQGLTVAEICTDVSGEHVQRLRAKTLAGTDISLQSDSYVLACGGLDTARLLLVSDANSSGGLGNASGMLGRNYMGHVDGRIALVRFYGRPKDTAFGFWRDRDGVYVRPRFTFAPEVQRRERLSNTASWIVNPTVGNPAHGNGVLSFAYLALSSPFGKYFASEAIRKATIGSAVPGSAWQHWLNMFRDLPRTAAFIPTFGTKRFLLHRRVPGFYQYSQSNCYDLHYHAEQVPNRESRATLSDQEDALGMRRLNIDLRFSEQDIDSVLRSHELLDGYLRKHGIGQLDYLPGDRRENVWAQARDGYHQVGLARMSHDPADGVVDANCRVYGVANLYLASCATFPTSGQANPTFTMVAFAIRLAEYLKDIRGTSQGLAQRVVVAST
jgi:choline dehydrogenase-like flavoprotein